MRTEKDPAVIADARRALLLKKWLRIDEHRDPEKYYEAEAAWGGAENELVATPASSLTGVLAKLRLVARILEGDETLTERAVLSAIADLEKQRLAAIQSAIEEA